MEKTICGCTWASYDDEVLPSCCQPGIDPTSDQVSSCQGASPFFFFSRCTHFYPPVAFFRKDAQEYKRCAERARKYRTVAKRSTFIVRCRCTRCRVLFSYRSKCARSMYRRARWEKLNSLNPMVSIRKSLWSLYFIQALSDFEKVILEQNQL